MAAAISSAKFSCFFSIPSPNTKRANRRTCSKIRGSQTACSQVHELQQCLGLTLAALQADTCEACLLFVPVHKGLQRYSAP